MTTLADWCFYGLRVSIELTVHAGCHPGFKAICLLILWFAYFTKTLRSPIIGFWPETLSP